MKKKPKIKTAARILFQKRGAALLTVMVISLAVITILREVWVSSQREYISSHHKLSELRARYSARSGMELSLIRLYIYKNGQRLLGDISLARPYLDMIWLPPVSWPFSQPENISESDKEALRELSAESFLKESYMAGIFPEDGRLNLNDLSSPVEYLRDFTYQTLLNLLNLSLEESETLGEKYSEGDFADILDNLADWTDRDSESRGGGSEDLIEDGASPLNRSFVSVEEIRKVPGVTEDIFQLLEPWVTVYGAKGLNINYAGKKILMALNIPEGLAEEILERTRIGGEFYKPFLKEEDFCSFAEARGLDICGEMENNYSATAVLKFGLALNFRARATGQSARSVSGVEALLYDPSSVIAAYKKAVQTQNKIIEEANAGGAEKRKSSKASKEKSTKKANTGLKNRGIGWGGEPPFFVMYWKEGL